MACHEQVIMNSSNNLNIKMDKGTPWWLAAIEVIINVIEWDVEQIQFPNTHRITLSQRYFHLK
mgnify:CR=1 FL=1